MADFSNYSMQDLVQEWIMDRARAPLLLKAAVAREGIEAVVAYAVEQGIPKGTIMFALQRAGCIAPANPKPASGDPFRDKVEKLWHKDCARLIAEVERLHAAR